MPPHKRSTKYVSNGEEKIAVGSRVRILGQPSIGEAKVNGYTGQYNYVKVTNYDGDVYIVPDVLLTKKGVR